MKPRYRWYLLCEDRDQERFFKRLGEKLLGDMPREIAKAPRGGGAAWDWVLKRYPDYVRRVRQYPSENVALIAVVDGDNEGFQKRKRRFDRSLSDAGQQNRAGNDQIALCVPTWSIETWLAHLCSWMPPSGPLDESRSLKQEVQRVLDKDVRWDVAVASWNQPSQGAAGVMASLEDAKSEMSRWR